MVLIKLKMEISLSKSNPMMRDVMMWRRTTITMTRDSKSMRGETSITKVEVIATLREVITMRAAVINIMRELINTKAEIIIIRRVAKTKVGFAKMQVLQTA